MWHSKFNIFEKTDGFNQKISSDYFTKPYSKEAFEFQSKYITDGRTFKDFPIPPYLKLPEEYIELLKYSNGGIIVNGEREFGFFDIQTIREMYLNYSFLIYSPDILPIAFNGGGVFYAYDFKLNVKNPPIFAIAANAVGDEEEYVFLGNTLEEVLEKTINIDDEINGLE